MTPSSSSTTKCSCRSWKPTSCSMRLPGWDTCPVRGYRLILIDQINVFTHYTLSLLFFFPSSHQLSLQSHKYHAAPTSSLTHLCVFLAATMCTSPLWKAHACPQASWLLAPGQHCTSMNLVEVFFMFLRERKSHSTMICLKFLFLSPLQDAGVHRWIFRGMCCSISMQILPLTAAAIFLWLAPLFLFWSSSAAVQPLPEDQPDGQQQRPLLQEDSGSRLRSQASEEVTLRCGRTGWGWRQVGHWWCYIGRI